jgi:hypothetical protein
VTELGDLITFPIRLRWSILIGSPRRRSCVDTHQRLCSTHHAQRRRTESRPLLVSVAASLTRTRWLLQPTMVLTLGAPLQHPLHPQSLLSSPTLLVRTLRRPEHLTQLSPHSGGHSAGDISAIVQHGRPDQLWRNLCQLPLACIIDILAPCRDRR